MPEHEQNHVLSIEEVLAEEADAIDGAIANIAGSLKERLGGTEEEKKERFERNFHRSADERDDNKVDLKTIEIRKELYCTLNKLNRAALCFSGGGIRSATFCLGIPQALARCADIPPPENGKQDETKKLEQSLLGCFHYLSTVSGGGYIGSWLSAWRKRASFHDIRTNLTSRPGGPDFEPPQISWLRAYSNYLTPRLGIGSADTWADVAIVVRNLVLNWFVIIPVVALAVLVLKLIATLSVWTAETVGCPAVMIPLALVGAAFLILAQAFTTFHRPALLAPPHETGPAAHPRRHIRCWLCRHTVHHEKGFCCRRVNINDTCFVVGDLAWAALSAIVLTVFFTSLYFSTLRDALSAYLDGPGAVPALVKAMGLTAKIEIPALTAIAGFIIFTIGWIVGWPQTFNLRDWARWAVSGLIYGALVGFGAYLFSLLAPYPLAGRHLPLLVAIIFGVPWIIMSQLTADNIFGGLVSYEPKSDSDREWLGRAAGWLSAFAAAWGIVAFLVFAGEYAVQLLLKAGYQYVVASGGVIGVLSGIVAALLGSSSKTPAKHSKASQTDTTALISKIGLAIAGPIFAAALIVTLSVALDKLLLGASLVTLLAAPEPSLWPTAFWLALGAGIAWLIGHIASRNVNINRFSLHALYRNRLIRAYLGATRDKRHPNRFTGFDGDDNVRMHELWPDDISPRRLFHVVNIALNVVSTKRLAWQERKAEPFIVTPRHSGGAYVGFRRSDDYGDSHDLQTKNRGIALGTAMAISGAAASPNMGYASSPSLALLLTLFNVRLGWWLGNPGSAGNADEAYKREGPRFAAKPLFDEALGRTTDQNPYVYLSDGGHFENLGLYEMVRRRCRLIVVVDAGCDPKFAFEDLGNAVRKIYIDLGVRIRFDSLQTLRNRPTRKTLKGSVVPEAEARQAIPYHAIGTVCYRDADGDGCEDGKVIYIKPAYHGVEGAAIRSYATANLTFPHETTLDQFFSESQFESYRALGLDIGHAVLASPAVQAVLRDYLT